jgi:hypothetical protein
MRVDGDDATPLGLGEIIGRVTQGSSCLATLGFGTQSRWDWEWCVHQSSPVKAWCSSDFFNAASAACFRA